jgi:lysozyme
MSLKVRALQFTAAGLIALAGYEGYERLPYQDSGGIWTDGFGNTHNVVPGKPVEVTAALIQLNKNTVSAQNAVNRCITSYISDPTFSSFVSFTYNNGNLAFCNSTIVKLYNAGNKHAACAELPKWSCITVKEGSGDKSGMCKSRKENKRFIKGLHNRRLAEQAMCLEGLQ